MTTLKDFISPEVKNTTIALVALLALCATGSSLYNALRTGVAQRLPSTPKYARSENPAMFWLLVIFFGLGVMLFVGTLIAAIVHWHDKKVL